MVGMKLPAAHPAKVLACLAFIALLHGGIARAGVVDANTADQPALEQVVGIGPAIAARIVEARREGGPFRDLDDLRDRVRGIGAANIRRIAAGGLAVPGSRVLPQVPGSQASAGAVRPTIAGACVPAGLELIVGMPRLPPPAPPPAPARGRGRPLDLRR